MTLSLTFHVIQNLPLVSVREFLTPPASIVIGALAMRQGFCVEFASLLRDHSEQKRVFKISFDLINDKLCCGQMETLWFYKCQRHHESTYADMVLNRIVCIVV